MSNYNPVRHGSPIYENTGRFIVGYVVGKNFKKTARSSVHMLKEPLGWACDVRSLQEAEAAGAKYVVIRDLDTRNTYKARISDFWTRGIDIERGFGKQKCLPLTSWQFKAPRSK